MQDIEIPTTGDEQSDHDAIEEAAAPLIAAGWTPEDAEMAEWLVLAKDGKKIEIRVV